MLQNDNFTMGVESVSELLSEVLFNTNHSHVSSISERFFTGTMHNPFEKVTINFND